MTITNLEAAIHARSVRLLFSLAQAGGGVIQELHAFQDECVKLGFIHSDNFDSICKKYTWNLEFSLLTVCCPTYCC